MKRKINSQLFWIAIIAIILTVISTTMVCYRIYQKQVRDDLRISAKLLRDTKYFESSDIDESEIDLSTDIKELRVTWVDSDGTVLYDNDNSADELTNHADRPEIKKAFEDGSGESIRQSSTMQKNTYYYAVLLQNGTVLRVSKEVESIFAVYTTSAPYILMIVILIIVLCMLLSHVLTKQILRPIEKIATNIKDMKEEPPYKELVPFTELIRQQHAEVLSAAKIRQDFTANVSHELKTPLTAISGYAELIDNGLVDEEGQKHFIQEIRKNTERLLSLINDIIRLSQLDRSEHEPSFEMLDLYDVVSECMSALRVNADRHQIDLYLEGEQCTVRGNREMLKELTDNLVQNSIRYNNPGGTVTVQIKGGAEPSLTVIDTGIGISKEDQERVFERFYRVDKSRSKETGGTGLGLAIVKHIVEIHDAKLSMVSALGEGTTIKVLF